ncbi:hypothetical protein [Chitinophaga pinensis]|uniref:Uncharacterized protein n=1 Tax=Chitinophaga pinensis (strain ATCC 43595 / DSM 2588 / LMG 13176 / NBRC 15968 / NCIMB 11800 / UQM 2034) TaxID=485918 RepID=A0A979G4Q3_CHIPD|nr:hypothetical protein [Chitinophaga pinensis]ACU60668.1 hypothetical protein Cpin_3201 [Chitinophaga pinensis DSM 2588]
MKSAKIMLACLACVTVVGGALALNARRFTGYPVWRTTDYITTVANGKTYATYGFFYTGTGTTLFISTTGTLSTVYRTTISLPPVPVIGTATDGSGFTAAIFTYPVTLTTTRVVTYF